MIASSPGLISLPDWACRDTALLSSSRLQVTASPMPHHSWLSPAKPGWVQEGVRAHDMGRVSGGRLGRPPFCTPCLPTSPAVGRAAPSTLPLRPPAPLGLNNIHSQGWWQGNQVQPRDAHSCFARSVGLGGLKALLFFFFFLMKVEGFFLLLLFLFELFYSIRIFFLIN